MISIHYFHFPKNSLAIIEVADPTTRPSHVSEEWGGTHWDLLSRGQQFGFHESRHSFHFPIHERGTEKSRKWQLLYSGSMVFLELLFTWICLFPPRSISITQTWRRCINSLHRKHCPRNMEELGSPSTTRSSKGLSCTRTKDDCWRRWLMGYWIQSQPNGITCADRYNNNNLW